MGATPPGVCTLQMQVTQAAGLSTRQLSGEAQRDCLWPLALQGRWEARRPTPRGAAPALSVFGVTEAEVLRRVLTISWTVF